MASQSFHGEALPTGLIDYRSNESKTRLCRALTNGTAVPYLALSSCFSFQSETRFCGLSTLAILLNALQIDPQRVWKTPWRWYTEDLLDCCRPLEHVKKVGITLEEFKCLADCNGTVCKLVRTCGLAAGETEQKRDYEQFRRALRCVCTGGVSEGDKCDGHEFDAENPSVFMAIAFRRADLSQSGEAGHFSPVAAMDVETDSALILDTARFKYPPYWVPIERLFKAMLAVDKVTNKPRGYLMLRPARDDVRGAKVCCIWQELGEKAADECLQEPHPVYQSSDPS